MCPQIFDNLLEVRLLCSSTCNTKQGSFKVLHDKRRLDRDQNEGDRPRILVIHSREESDPRVVLKIDLILHSNTNITEASSRHVIKRPMKLSYTIPIDISAQLFQHIQ